MVRFDLGTLLQGQTRIPKLKSAYNLLITGPRGLQCETNLYEIIGWESFDVVRFDIWPLLQGQMRTAKLKSAYNLFIIDARDLQCETNFLKIMGEESFDVVRFDLGPLLPVDTNLHCSPMRRSSFNTVNTGTCSLGNKGACQFLSAGLFTFDYVSLLRR